MRIPLGRPVVPDEYSMSVPRGSSVRGGIGRSGEDGVVVVETVDPATPGDPVSWYGESRDLPGLRYRIGHCRVGEHDLCSAVGEDVVGLVSGEMMIDRRDVEPAAQRGPVDLEHV